MSNTTAFKNRHLTSNQFQQEGSSHMRQIYNFSAGPAMLPEEVLLQAQAEMLDWHHTGMSIMELSHRGTEFKEVAEQSEADIRALMEIPKNYHVLFLAGGASTQFAMVPLNLMAKKNLANYVDTGIWSRKAITEAARYGKVQIAATLAQKNDLFTIPDLSQWQIDPQAAYLHYTPNETIDGVQFHWIPSIDNMPLVADMTSMILSEPIDVNRFGLIYAGAQKNLGQAGITIVIIREDLIGDALPNTPTLYQYKLQAENASFYNTPPTYNWYITSLVLAWIKRQGGVKALGEINRRKASKLYTLIDSLKDFYVNPVLPSDRSIMNVVFSLKQADLVDVFLSEADKEGLKKLKGHRLGPSGGLRASIYNGMPEAGVDKLVEFMTYFAKKYG